MECSGHCANRVWPENSADRFDSTDYLLDGLRNKAIDGLIVQNPRQMGYLAVKAAIAAAHKTPVRM